MDGNSETGSTCSDTSFGMHPKKRKRSSEENEWMKTAASALTKLSQDNDDQQDEWDVFGVDVANSLRAINSPEWQRRAKFAVQSAIFQAAEKARCTVSNSTLRTDSTIPVIDSFFKNFNN